MQLFVEVFKIVYDVLQLKPYFTLNRLALRLARSLKRVMLM